MGKAVTRGQALELAGQFCRDINWDALSSEGVQAIIDLTPEERSARFTAFLKNGASLTIMAVADGSAPVPVALPRLTAWRTFRIGGMNKKNLLKRVRSGGVEVSSYAEGVMNNRSFTTLDAEEEIDTIVLEVRDFGYEHQPMTSELLDPSRLAEWSKQNAHRLPEGYDAIELLPAEAGPHIRDQYKDQPNGEVLWMAMERIAASGGSPGVFGVERGGGVEQWLRASWSCSGDQWFLDLRLVFRLRKKVTQD